MIALGTLLAILCGGAVGFSLGLVGGGGSILAVPLLLYVVGVKDPHVAIGTGALAVSANAFVNFIEHCRAGTVKWPCALLFAGTGGIGAAIGSALGKSVDGQRLVFFFSLLMFAIGFAMLRPQRVAAAECAPFDVHMALRLALLGAAAGLLSGFFGIGGGFLIVPGIMWGSGMPIINAIGCSLFSVAVFSLITAGNYALSGFVDWTLALEFMAGGALGGYLGLRAAVVLAAQKRTLTYVFVGVVFVTASYIALRSTLI